MYVIGIGPGDPDYLLPAATKAVSKCQVLVGGSRALNLFPDRGQERLLVTADLSGLKRFLQERLEAGKNVAVLVSGDPGFYSLLPFLKKSFPTEPLEVIPGISSLQAAFARAALPWQGSSLQSAHGRPLTEIDTDQASLLGLLTGKDNTPQRIAAYLLEQGPNRRAFVGDNLSYSQEIWLETDLQELAASVMTYANAVVIVLPWEED